MRRCRKRNEMNHVNSDGGTRQHRYTTAKSITIPFVPNRKSRDRIETGGESRMPEGRGNKQ